MRAFDAALLAALTGKVTALALGVKIKRSDGQIIRFIQTTEQMIIDGELFVPAAGVTVASIPFELNGAATRIDLNVVSTDGGTIDAQDIRDGLYDNATVSIYLIDRNSEASLRNILFIGYMGPIIVTERGFATIEMIGLLDRANQLVSEVYTPVCRADFGDRRCKVDLVPLTQRVKVVSSVGYDLVVFGLNAASNETGAKAHGSITFWAQPTSLSQIRLNWVWFTFFLMPWSPTQSDLNFANDPHVITLGDDLGQTLQSLLGTIGNAGDNALAVASYDIVGASLTVTATANGAAWNSYALASGALSNSYASGATLKGGAGSGNYFVNGQVIFRTGRLINEAYEIQASEGSVISLFTPTEFPPESGDELDIIQGCDHSPFAAGCGKYINPDTGTVPNIANYRGEPWAPGDAIAADLSWITTQDAAIQIGPGGKDNNNGTPPPPPAEPAGLWAFYFSVSSG
jgi:uncharacterized phage protein (TIGR02218 family)